MFDAITKCWCSGAEQLKQMVNHENIVADETQANHNTGNSGLTFDSDSVTLRIVGRISVCFSILTHTVALTQMYAYLHTYDL